MLQLKYVRCRTNFRCVWTAVIASAIEALGPILALLLVAHLSRESLQLLGPQSLYFAAGAAFAAAAEVAFVETRLTTC